MAGHLLWVTMRLFSVGSNAQKPSALASLYAALSNKKYGFRVKLFCLARFVILGMILSRAH